jgi:hypothetical protein
MVPAKEVGGDLFDFFLLDPERLGFVLGDVNGKGVPAALFMAIASTLLRAAELHHASPSACLTSLNESLVAKRASGMFVTLFYGILNTLTGVLEYSNGGHNPPYVFSPDGRVLRAEGARRPHARCLRAIAFYPIALIAFSVIHLAQIRPLTASHHEGILRSEFDPKGVSICDSYICSPRLVSLSPPSSQHNN